MKRIRALSVIFILIIPFVFLSCNSEDKNKINFEEGIPSSGTYFKIQVDDIVLAGDDFLQMHVNTSPQGAGYNMFDFIVCSNIENGINIIDTKVYISVKENDDNSFSNYRVQYIKNKIFDPIGKFFNFEEWMEYKTGSLNVIRNDGNTITAKFTGTLKAANNYREDAQVIIYFQEFPINPTYTENNK